MAQNTYHPVKGKDIEAAAVSASAGFTGDLTGNVTGNVAGNVTGNSAGVHVGGLQLPMQVISGDGAITIKTGVVILTKGSAAAITLAAPTATTDDGKILYIIAGSAQAHVVTVTGAAGGSGQDVGTFGGAINDSTVLVAYNGVWYVVGAPRNVTWA
jgi:hypothetical protein